jgi:hypothetical protein
MISATFLWSPAVQRCFDWTLRPKPVLFPRWGWVAGVKRQAQGKNMKIYLLMVLIGTLLSAIRFTSRPEQQSNTLPNS